MRPLLLNFSTIRNSALRSQQSHPPTGFVPPNFPSQSRRLIRFAMASYASDVQWGKTFYDGAFFFNFAYLAKWNKYINI